MEIRVIYTHRLHIKRNLLISIIISELLCIVAFLFSPDSSKTSFEVKYADPIILINNIQPTIQSPKRKRIKPPTPVIVIADAIEEPEIMDDVIVASTSSKKEDSDASKDFTVLESSSISTAPRLTFEVIPEGKDDKISGSLNLFLKIGTNGKVTSHKVLFSSIECENCMDKIISAVYRSKWQPALSHGIEVDYWVEKSYVFN